MTELLEKAIEAVRGVPPDEQDDIARAVLQLSHAEEPPPVPLTAEERAAIANSKAAAKRGEFAAEEDVRAVWAKHSR